MAETEAARLDGIEAVAIVTPNHLHAPVAEGVPEGGFHVICDKPVTTTVKDARSWSSSRPSTTCIFAVTHNYTGYPMVRHARHMVREGQLGEIRVVQVEYPQGWLTKRLEASGQKQAAWRTDPTRSGAGGAIGDIGTHADNLADYITGLEIVELCAELTHVRERPQARRQRAGDAALRQRRTRALWASQVAPGNENNLRIRVYGSKGGIEWRQEHPNQLHWSSFGQPTR